MDQTLSNKAFEENMKKVGEARAENELMSKVLDQSLEALKADFGEAGGSEAGAEFPIELEKELYMYLIEIMQDIAGMSEEPAEAMSDDEDKKLKFGILLSGILSNQNGHALDRLDVELHDTRSERAVKKILNKEWCIDDGYELIERVRTMMDGDYVNRFARYSSVDTAEELFDDDMDELDRSSESRAFRFAHTFRGQISPKALAGWDLGRAAMITRWGAFVGWITRKQADDLLREQAELAAKAFSSFRAFAQSYIVGALLYKLICEEPDAKEYMEKIYDSIQELIRGEVEEGIGQWKSGYLTV